MVHLLINENSFEAVKMLEFLKTQPYIEVLNATPNRTTQKAILDAKNKKTSQSFDKVSSLMQELKS